MRNINITKVANVLSIFVMVVILLTPLLVDAQFRVPTAAGTDPVPTDTKITDILIRIIQILLAVAGLIAVIFLIVGGFRYITAAGNEETAEAAKKTITNAIIGIVVIILAFVIVRVVANAVIGGQTNI